MTTQNQEQAEAMIDEKDQETAHDENENDTIEPQEDVKEEPSLEQQLADMKDQWMRALADSENMRRRSTKDREEALKFGATSFARDIVGTVDNLQRALGAVEKVENQDDHLKNLVAGIEMTLKDIHGVFTRHNIKTIDALHVKFDPNHHQAMFEIETDEHEPGTVMQVVQSGYLIHDRLLRPAMVGVSKAKSTQDEPE